MLTGPERGPQLKAHIEQIAWAGELEGWLTAPPRIHLVAGPAEAAALEAAARGLGRSRRRDRRLPPLRRNWPPTAPSAPATTAPTANLLPPEFSARYHQQFMDRLWMRGVMAVVAVYIFGVLGLFRRPLSAEATIQRRPQPNWPRLGAAYTNALRTIMQIKHPHSKRQNLKYAALDCWKAMAENLPENLTLDNFYFNRDRIELGGTATSEQPRRTSTPSTTVCARPRMPRTPDLLFSDVKLSTLHLQGSKTAWSLTCNLKSSETP